MPASKDELIQITTSRVELESLKKDLGQTEGRVNKLENEIKELRKEKEETQNRISDRRLAIYLTLASIFGAAIVAIIEWLIK